MGPRALGPALSAPDAWPDRPATAPHPQGALSRLARWPATEPGYRFVLIVIVALSTALAAAWIAVDRTPPAWDQARYLSDALQYVNGFHHAGVGGAVNAFFTSDRYYAPGYIAFIFPFMLVLGPSAQSALIANLVLWVALLLAVAAITRRLFGRSAGLIAVMATATIPEILSLLHQPLLDLAAATWACLALLMMLKTSHFERTVPTALTGAFVGVGLLTKATVLIFLLGPVSVIGLRAILHARTASTTQRLRVAGNVALGLVIALVLAAPWYVTNWDTTLAYLQSSAFGEGSIGMGPANPLDPAALGAFALTGLNAMSLVVAAGVATLGIWLVWSRLFAPRDRRTGPARRTWSWLLLAALAFTPLVVFATSHNQDPRQMVVSFPGLAMMFAGLAVVTRPRLLSVAVVGVVVVSGIAQALLAQLPPGNDLRDTAQIHVNVGSQDLMVFGPSFGVANPRGDDGTPVMRELEAVAGGRPVHVLVAQDDHVLNPNTLGWLAETRKDGLTFGLPNQLSGDPAELDGYDVAIYMPAPELAQRDPALRLQLLNQRTASAVYGDQLFHLFGRSRHQVALFGGITVWVLER